MVIACLEVEAATDAAGGAAETDIARETDLRN